MHNLTNLTNPIEVRRETAATNPVAAPADPGNLTARTVRTARANPVDAPAKGQAEANVRADAPGSRVTAPEAAPASTKAAAMPAPVARRPAASARAWPD